MWLSVQQVLADSSEASGTPKATFDAATLHLEPGFLHLVTELSHPEDQARQETKLRKLQAQVSVPCCPTLALEQAPQSTPQAHHRLSKDPNS